ncbi:MAG: DUF4337 domain-containing protein [Hyphomonadaceae bacterium]|nr:DUF4337 domain-containing protein [Hyphomonadaceae bacterium]
MPDIDAPERGSDPFANRVALTIALLASFIAFGAIKSGNVAEAMQQAQAERNNGWAWYQAVRVREDMATYELAHLQRLARTAPPEEAARLAPEMTAQAAEIARIRARLEETRTRAQAAEADYERLNLLGDHYDLADALMAIAITLMAVATLSAVRWLYWFGLIPAVGGIVFGAAAMVKRPFDMHMLFVWLG